MFMIDNGNRKIELKASAGAYRKLKFLLGVSNLKAAYFEAFQSVDVDFLLHVVECFGKMEYTDAEAFVDEAFETGKINEMFTEVAQFLNGMGFFGDLNLAENESVIDYFKNPLNRVDMNETMARAMRTALDESVTGIVKEQVEKENKKK